MDSFAWLQQSGVFTVYDAHSYVVPTAENAGVQANADVRKRDKGSGRCAYPCYSLQLTTFASPLLSY